MRININGVIVPNDHKWIYDFYEVEATSPKDVITKLEEATDDVNIYISSGGGSVDAGNQIYTAIKDFKGDVTIYVTSMAGSAASIIATAAKCYMSPPSMMMVHNVSSVAGGDYHDMDKMSEILKTANKALASAYMAKSGMTEEEALEMMDKETWLTSAQAVEKGLADGIMFEDVQLVASFENGMIPKAVIDKMMANKAPNGAFLMAKSKLRLLALGGAKNE